MGTYIDATDVQLRMQMYQPTAFSISTQPTLARVDELIVEVEAELDGYLRSAIGSAPLTDTRDINAVKPVSSMYAAYLAYLEAGYAHHREAETPENVRHWKHQWERFTSGLINGSIVLPSSVSTNEQARVIKSKRNVGIR